MTKRKPKVSYECISRAFEVSVLLENGMWKEVAKRLTLTNARESARDFSLKQPHAVTTRIVRVTREVVR